MYNSKYYKYKLKYTILKEIKYMLGGNNENNIEKLHQLTKDHLDEVERVNREVQKPTHETIAKLAEIESDLIEKNKKFSDNLNSINVELNKINYNLSNNNIIKNEDYLLFIKTLNTALEKVIENRNIKNPN